MPLRVHRRRKCAISWFDRLDPTDPWRADDTSVFFSIVVNQQSQAMVGDYDVFGRFWGLQGNLKIKPAPPAEIRNNMHVHQTRGHPRLVGRSHDDHCCASLQYT